MDRVAPIMETNAGYISGKQTRASLFLPNPFLVFTISVVVGLVMFVATLVSLRGLIQGWQLDSSGQRVNGVVDFVEIYSQKNGQACRITYSYTVDGISQTSTESSIPLSYGSGLSARSPVPVVYLTSQPYISRLGIPGQLWGPSQGITIAIFLLTLVAAAGCAYYGFRSGQEVAMLRRLLRDGRVVTAQVVSYEVKDAHKGKVQTDLVYQVPTDDGSAIGRATYVTQGSGPVRRLRAGEKIPVLYSDPSTHRPL